MSCNYNTIQPENKLIPLQNYGLTDEDLFYSREKIADQERFLNTHFVNIEKDNKIEKVYLADFFKNAYINYDRYFSELYHRVYSLSEYCSNLNLINIFITLTLPTEYHKSKTLFNGDVVPNPKYANQHLKKEIYDIKTKQRVYKYSIPVFKYSKALNKIVKTEKNKIISFDFEDFTPSKGSKKLSKMLSAIRDDRSYKNEISKDKKAYFRVTEPHKDGTPHLHISMWIPKENFQRVVDSIQRKFPAPLSDLSTNYLPDYYKEYKKVYRGKDKKMQSAFKKDENDKQYIKTHIKDNLAYLLKYMYKTLDNLKEKKEISFISAWYIHNGISRFHSSNTLVSLNVYRPLLGRFKLNELTNLVNNKDVIVNYEYKKVRKYDKEKKELTHIKVRYVSSIEYKKDGLEYETIYQKTNYIIQSDLDLEDNSKGTIIENNGNQYIISNLKHPLAPPNDVDIKDIKTILNSASEDDLKFFEFDSEIAPDIFFLDDLPLYNNYYHIEKISKKIDYVNRNKYHHLGGLQNEDFEEIEIEYIDDSDSSSDDEFEIDLPII